MKFWTTLSAMALLALVSTWGLSGCSKNDRAVANPVTDKKESGKEDEHAKHAEAKRAGATDEEHDGHKRGEHKGHEHGDTPKPTHVRGGSHMKGEHPDHKAGDPHDKALPGSIKVGNKVPDFEIRTLDGKSLKLSDLQKDVERTKKGVIVLTFWCATCHSCRDMEEFLAKLAKDYAGQAVVLALDANTDDTAQVVAEFLKKKGLTLPVVLDPTGHTADVFGVQRTTTTVVIDGNGVLRYCGQFKQKDGASAEEAMKAVLAGNEVAVKTTPHNG